MKRFYVGAIVASVIMFNGGLVGVRAEDQAAPPPQQAEQAQVPAPAPAAAPAQADEDLTNYSYGTIVRASASEIVLSEYDLATDGDIEVTYKVDSKIEMENIKSLDEIKAGDNVDIDYVEKDGAKTAVYIAKEVLGEEG